MTSCITFALLTSTKRKKKKENVFLFFFGSYLSVFHLQLQTHSACILCRRAYHPFVWNSLSPYRDTTEIDYLIAMVRACSFSATFIRISLVSQQPQFICIYVFVIYTIILLYLYYFLLMP